MLDTNTQAGAAHAETLPIEFKFQNDGVRTIIKDYELWLIAADVCKVLELSDPTKALSRLDDDERGATIVRTLGGPQEVNIINESGLYSLVLTILDGELRMGGRRRMDGEAP